MKKEDKVPMLQHDLPAAIRLREMAMRAHRDKDLSFKLSLMECGIQKYMDEEKLCEEFGISTLQLKYFKERNRPTIEQFKDEHREVKAKILREISHDGDLLRLYEQHKLQGDEEAAKRIIQIMETRKKFLPASVLRDMAEVVKNVEATPDPIIQSGGMVNIQINPALVEAQRMLEDERRKDIETKLIEVKDAKVVGEKT